MGSKNWSRADMEKLSMDWKKWSVEQTWDVLNNIMQKLISTLEEGSLGKRKFWSAEDYVLVYSIQYNHAYRSASAKRINNFKQIYKRYKQSLLIYINSRVLPALREKQGEAMVREFVDRTLLEGVLGIFADIGMDVYANEIEVPLLEDTADFYVQRAGSWNLGENSCMDYLLKAGECMQREEEIAAHYLHRSREKLLEMVPNELLSGCKTQLLENLGPCCCALLRSDNKHDLSKLYSLFCRVPEGLETMVNAFKERVIRDCTPLVMRDLDAITDKVGRRDTGGMQEEVAFVNTVLELRDKFAEDIIHVFRHNALLHRALNETFVEICNKTVAGNTSEEFLAKLCDMVLRKGGSSKRLRSDEIEGILENVTKFLKYVNDKDLFGEFYRTKLAGRLLYDKSTDNAHELSMLLKLKQHIGNQLTSKMESMVKDMLQAEVNQASFKAYLTNNPNIHPGINLDVRVLNFTFWPPFKSSEPSLPLEMIKCVNTFKEFYSTYTQNRQLTWLYSTGTCNVIGKFQAEQIEMVVTPYYAILLLLFNSSQKLSYLDIKAGLNLRDEDLVRLLHSIVFSKYKILLKEPDTKEISLNDTFEINYSFTNTKEKIKILLPTEDRKEKKKVIENVDMNRYHEICALIVRIMKSKKSLHYEQLMNECNEQHGGMFEINVKVFKKSIENLIIRDYLERDKQNLNILKYIS
eukprot:PITA_19279